MNARRPDGLGARPRAYRPAAGLILAAAILFFSAAFSFGAPKDLRNFWGFSLGGMFPAGAFGEHVSQTGGGIYIFYGRKPWRLPVYLGFELSENMYGNAHRHEYLENIPEVRIDVDTNNNIVQGLLFLRAQPVRGAVRPYVEGLAGISYLYTETVISGHNFPWDEVSSDTNFDAFTVTAGAGAGLAILFRPHRVPKPGYWLGNTRLDIKVRYLAGGRASYLKQGSIVIVDDEVTYTAEKSATSFISAQVGLSFHF